MFGSSFHSGRGLTCRRHGMGSFAAGVSRPPTGLGFKPVSRAFPRQKFPFHPFRPIKNDRICDGDIGGAFPADALSALRTPGAVEGGGTRAVGLVPQLQLKVRQAKVGLLGVLCHDLTFHVMVSMRALPCRNSPALGPEIRNAPSRSAAAAASSLLCKFLVEGLHRQTFGVPFEACCHDFLCCKSRNTDRR